MCTAMVATTEAVALRHVTPLTTAVSACSRTGSSGSVVSPRRMAVLCAFSDPVSDSESTVGIGCGRRGSGGSESCRVLVAGRTRATGVYLAGSRGTRNLRVGLFFIVYEVRVGQQGAVVSSDSNFSRGSRERGTLRAETVLGV